MRSIKTEMDNLRLSETTAGGCLKTENSSSSSSTGGEQANQVPALPNHELSAAGAGAGEQLAARDASSSDFDTYSFSLNSLVPPLTGIKFEDNNNNTNNNGDDVAIRSSSSPGPADYYSLWESIFSDGVLQDGDFMLCSPIRNNNNNNMMPNYMYSPSILGQNNNNNLVVSSSSPPRFPSPLGGHHHHHHHKGKGLSPLHRVFNSPNNNQLFMQVDQIESLSLPPLENLLDDDDDDDSCFDKDNEFMINASSSSSSWGKIPAGGGGQNNITTSVPPAAAADCYDDALTAAAAAVPEVEVLECLGMTAATRFSDHHQQPSHVNVTHVTAADNSVYPPQSLSQHLQQERQEEQQQQQQQHQQLAPLQSRMQRHTQQQQQQQQLVHQPNQLQNMHNTLMMGPILAPEQEQADSGLQLVHVLLACAEAVSTEDYMSARRYLHHLNRVVSPLGDSMQRVAACFTEALSARLAATLTCNKPITTTSIINHKPPLPFNPFPPDNLEILKIYQILYQACPYIKFAHFTANQAIFEAFEAEERVHVIDLDIVQGYQWPAFMQALAARPGGPPFLRITGVGPSMESVMETGRCLTELALSLHVPFEFHPIGEQLEDLKPHMFNRRVGEALAVNSINRLHRVPGHSLGNLLSMIRDQAPNIVTIVEQEASHNGPYFLGRFLEALHYFSAFFDSLDATFPPDSAQRAKVEQHILAPEIRNIVAHEGAERVMRHERLEKWRKMMEGKGFQGVALSGNAVTQSKILLGLYSCDGYRLTEDKGCLLLGWQDRSLLAASAWRC